MRISKITDRWVSETNWSVVLLFHVIQRTSSLLHKGVTIGVLASVHFQLFHFVQIKPTLTSSFFILSEITGSAALAEKLRPLKQNNWWDSDTQIKLRTVLSADQNQFHWCVYKFIWVLDVYLKIKVKEKMNHKQRKTWMNPVCTLCYCVLKLKPNTAVCQSRRVKEDKKLPTERRTDNNSVYSYFS